MVDEEIREEQAAELEAMEAIFGDDFEKLEADSAEDGEEYARFQVDLNDIDAYNHVKLRLLFGHKKQYPHGEPIQVVVHPLDGISGPQRKSLQKHLDEIAMENIGIPTAYTLCEEAREYLVNQEGTEQNGGNTADDNEEQNNSKFETLDNTQGEKVEVISSKAIGTPVTEETFQEWRQQFMELFVYKGKSKEELEGEQADGKMTGRQFFESKTVVVSAESASFWESEAGIIDAES